MAEKTAVKTAHSILRAVKTVHSILRAVKTARRLLEMTPALIIWPREEEKETSL
jgi:2,3-bisphosphoglycerate-independent phosphoglycerate mutase